LKFSVLTLAFFCTIFFSGEQHHSSTARPSIQQASLNCDPRKKNAPQMVKIRSLKGAWQIQRGCGFPAAEHVGFAIDVFYKKWKREFGDPNDKVLKTLNGLMIEWGRKKKPIIGGAFDMNGDPIKGTARGLTLMPGYIWVWENQYKRIAATALVHELVHTALWAQNGYHGDPDHEGSEFEGWTPAHTKFIREINILLAGLDI
tara:strand:+ start:3746 stop:4351 length:606 start_codon:yes stop_codon:yes gene_type:complete